MPCDQFLQSFEISRAFLRVNQVGEKRNKFRNFAEIAHKPVVPTHFLKKIWPKIGNFGQFFLAQNWLK